MNRRMMLKSYGVVPFALALVAKVSAKLTIATDIVWPEGFTGAMAAAHLAMIHKLLPLKKPTDHAVCWTRTYPERDGDIIRPPSVVHWCAYRGQMRPAFYQLGTALEMHECPSVPWHS